jgi:hypothetical protein
VAAAASPSKRPNFSASRIPLPVTEMADVVAVAHEEARRDDASDDRPIWSSPDTGANVAFANHLDTY